MVVRRLRTAVSAISSFYAFRPELLALGVSSIPCLCQLNSTPTCRLTFHSSNRAWEAPSWGQGLGLDHLELYREGNRASTVTRIGLKSKSLSLSLLARCQPPPPSVGKFQGFEPC